MSNVFKYDSLLVCEGVLSSGKRDAMLFDIGLLLR